MAEIFVDYNEFTETDILKIIGNYRCNYMLLKNGFVLSWGGQNSLSLLGWTIKSHYLEQINPNIIEFNYLKEKIIITDIVCGFQHCLAHTLDGKVLSWGENESGQVINLSNFLS